MKYVSNKNGDHCVFTAKTGRLVASMYNAKETKMVLDALNKTDIVEKRTAPHGSAYASLRHCKGCK